MRCQSFRTSIDQLTGSHSNSPGKYNRDYGFPKDCWYSIADSWRKKDCESTGRHPANVCQIGCCRIASLWFGRVLLGRSLHSGQDLQTGQIWLQGHSCWKLAWFLRICASFWGVYCSVNFGMVEFAALTVWLHWMRCQSFRTSLDKMTESHSNSSGKYGGYRSSVRRQLKRLLQENQIQYPTKATWLLQTFIALILMGCDTSMADIWNILRVCPFHVCMGSSTNWPRVNCWSCSLREFTWPSQELLAQCAKTALWSSFAGHTCNCLDFQRRLILQLFWQRRFFKGKWFMCTTNWY